MCFSVSGRPPTALTRSGAFHLTLAACTRNCALNKLRSKGKDMQCGELMEDILSCGDIENDMENAEQLAIISDGLERLSKQDKRDLYKILLLRRKTLPP